MKKVLLLAVLVCFLFVGCGTPKQEDSETNVPETPNVETDAGQGGAGSEEQKKPGTTVYPLPDTTMENLTDAILAVSLEEGDAYVDDTGKMQMDVKIYTYDIYDMIDIAALKAGDTIVTHSGEVEVLQVERNELGTVYVNGGLDNGGFDLVTDDSGVFYETGYSDAKNWYEVGEATIRVSVDFIGYDNADPDQGEVILYPGGFLVGEVKDYNFTPNNTTIRVEGGQVVEMNRRYVP